MEKKKVDHSYVYSPELPSKYAYAGEAVEKA